MDWTAFKNCKKPIVLYGMGNGADRILAQLAQVGVFASGVFASDGFANGKLFHGFPVISYEDAKKQFGDMIVLLSFGTHLPEVMQNVMKIAAEQELYIPDLPVVEGELFTQEFENRHAQELCAVRKLLADEISVKTFDAILEYKRTWKPEPLLACQMPQEEAYRQILRLSQHEVLADLGAYRGDTVAEFLKYCQSCDGVLAVEPDAYSFRKLTENTKNVANCRLVHAAVSDCVGTAAFCKKRGRGSHLAQGSEQISTQTLDELMQGQRVSFINMDVEGAESKAISGAKRTIERYKPKILMAAYHRSCDLFSLPLAVLKYRPDYRIYLRHHPAFPAWDTNFYLV